jgi:hypothetical protein
MGDNEAVEVVFGLIFLIPYLIGPALILAELIIAGPVLFRRRPVTRRRRSAAIISAVLCLFWAFQLIGWFMDLGAYGVVLMAGLVLPAIIILVAIRRLPAV